MCTYLHMYIYIHIIMSMIMSIITIIRVCKLLGEKLTVGRRWRRSCCVLGSI